MKPVKKSKVDAFFNSLHYIRFEFLISFINLIYVGSGMLYALIIFAFNFEIYDLIIATSFFFFIISLLGLSLFLTIEEKSAILSIILHVIIILIYIVVALFNVFFIPILILNILSIFSYKKNFRIKPSFKSNSKKLMYLLLLFLILPIILSFVLDVISPQIYIPARSQNIDVNFFIEFEHKDRLGVLDLPIYTNSSPLSDEVIANISYWNNNLPNVNVSITLAVHQSQLIEDNSSAINCTKRLNSSGIAVDAWLLMNKENGYWPSDNNAHQFFQLYNETFRAWKNNYSLYYRGICIDAESLHLSDYALAIQDLLTIPLTFWGTTHNNALLKFEDLIEQVHNDNMEIGITTYQYLIPDDLFDGDDSLQRILDIPCYPPYGYDYYSIMSYAQGPGSEYATYLNGKMMQRYFQQKPGNPSIAINVIREPISSIVKKIQILRNLGFNKIFIYSLEGFLDTMPNGLDDLNQLFQQIQNPQAVIVNYTTISVFYGLQIHILIRYLIFCFDWWIFWYDLPI
ncbi:MAG: hypothetical protein ACTSVY_00800 [Candidatus Helarchaeota archaeon]